MLYAHRYPLTAAEMKSKVQFRVRIYRDDSIAIGPGKVQLLETIAETGSISAAARQLDMSYRRAWQLVSEMNATLIEPVVTTSKGGSHGGGAGLSPTGVQVIKHYRAMEAAARAGASADITALNRLLAP